MDIAHENPFFLAPAATSAPHPLNPLGEIR
jgi:hypothetical protein